MQIFKGFLGGTITATLAIIIAEIVLNYGLGDVVKDFFVRVFGKAKSLAEARYNRLTAKAKALKAKLPDLSILP